MRGAFTRATFRAWSWAWSFSDPGAKGSAKARKAAYKQSGHNWHGIAKETNIDLNEASGIYGDYCPCEIGSIEESSVGADDEIR